MNAIIEELAAKYEARALDCDSSFVRTGARECLGKASAYRQVAHDLRRILARDEMESELRASATYEGPF